MLSGERQLEIINIIRESGVAEVEYLAKTLGVSTMTIRRDLKKLVINTCGSEKTYIKREFFNHIHSIVAVYAFCTLLI